MINLKEAKKILNQKGADGLRDLLYNFKEILPDDLHTLNPEDYTIQSKWDGWFTATLVENGKGTMYSRNKRYKENLDCKGLNDNIYFGELIENTQWSFNFKNGTYHGKLIIFDILIKDKGLIDFISIDNCKLNWIETIITKDSNNLKKTFDRIISEGFEGIILINKKTGERIKVKKIIEDDFEILGFEISDSETAKRVKGMIKNFIYGKDGKKIGKCCGMPEKLKIDMFHNPDKYIGRIVKISGKEQFSSGALRHPNFVCIRSMLDKNKV